MKKFIAFVFAALLSAVAFADTETVDGVTYTYSISNGEATLGTGSRAAAIPTSTSGAIVIPSTLGGCPVTTIGYYAFGGCSSLTSMTIPDSVTTIGLYAFGGCISLKEIIGWKPGCPIDVESIVISKCVTRIGTSAFYGCNSLKSVTIPESVTEIGDRAFCNCSSLTSLVIPRSVISIGASAFCGTPFYSNLPDGLVTFGEVLYNYKGVCPSVVIIPDMVTTVSDYAFYDCSSLRSVTVPDGVMTVGENAFGGCESLMSVEILREDTTHYSNSAFAKCPNIVSVTCWSTHSPVEFGIDKGRILELNLIDNSEVLSGDMNGFRSLESLSISEGVTDISGLTFSDSNYISILHLPSTIRRVGCMGSIRHLYLADWRKWFDIDFSVAIAAEDVAVYLNGKPIDSLEVPDDICELKPYCLSGMPVSNAIIPNSVTNIHANAFLGSRVNRVVLPEGLLEIKDDAFCGCVSLEEVNIPSTVVNIGSSAFAYTKIDEIIIESGVTNIGENAFYNCSSLTNAEINASIEVLGKGLFAGCTKLLSVKIPATIDKIPENCFNGCTSLLNVDFPVGIADIGREAFRGCASLSSIELPSIVTNIAYASFYGCSSLSDFRVPENLKYIGNNVFQDCYGLSRVTVDSVEHWMSIRFDNETANPLWYAHDLYVGEDLLTELVVPEAVREVKPYSFCSAKGLTNIVFSAIETIGHRAFYGCSALETIHVPDTVKTIERGVFEGCGVKRVIIDSLESWCDIDFRYYSWEYPISSSYRLELKGEGLTELLIPDGVKEIKACSFCGCKGITKVVVPNSVTAIGARAFEGVSGVKALSIPRCVNSISSIFGSSYYTDLEEVILGESYTTIGTGLFSSCRNVSRIIIPDSVNRIAKNAFVGTKLYNDCDEGLVFVDDWLAGVKGGVRDTLTIPADTKHIADGVFDGVIIYTEEGRLEYEPEDLIGKTIVRVIDDIYAFADADQQAILACIEKEREPPTPPTLPSSFELPDGVEIVGVESGAWESFEARIVTYDYATCTDYNSCFLDFNIPSTEMLNPNAIGGFIDDTGYASIRLKVNGLGRLTFLWGVAEECADSREGYRTCEWTEWLYPYDYDGQDVDNAHLDSSLYCYLDGTIVESRSPCTWYYRDECKSASRVEVVIDGDGEHEIEIQFSSQKDGAFGYIGELSFNGDEENECRRLVLNTKRFKGDNDSDYWSPYFGSYSYHGEQMGYCSGIMVLSASGIPLVSSEYDVVYSMQDRWGSDWSGDLRSAFKRPGTGTISVNGGALVDTFTTAYGYDMNNEYEDWLSYNVGGYNNCYYDNSICEYVYEIVSGEGTFDIWGNNGDWHYNQSQYYYVKDCETNETISSGTLSEISDYGTCLLPDKHGIYSIYIEDYSEGSSDYWHGSEFWSERWYYYVHGFEVFIRISPKRIDELEIELTEGALVYSGDMLKQDCVVGAGGVSVYLKDNVVVNAGDYVMTVLVSGDYAGIKNIPFTVAPKPITDSTLQVYVEPVVAYTGLPQRGRIHVKDMARDVELVENVEYIVSEANNVSVGQATLVITGIGNYCGSIEKTFDIKYALQDVDFECDEATFKYDGTIKSPQITLVNTFTQQPLVENVGFSREGFGITPATYDVVFAGINDYYGVVTQRFDVVNGDIVIGDVVGCEVVYDGLTHGISVEVTSPGETDIAYSLDENGPYEEMVRMTDVCDTNIWYEVSAQYYNSVTGSAQVVILPRSIESETLIAHDRVVAWNGELPCPQVCVTNDVTGALMPGRDFTVTYLDNNRVGIARIVIDGIGNYCGSVTNEFTITKGAVAMDYDPEAAPNQFLWQWTGLDYFPCPGEEGWTCDFDYDGTEKSVWIYTNDNADIVDIAITGVTNAVNAGVYTARARGSITRYATDEYYNYTYVTAIDQTITMTIRQRDISSFPTTLNGDIFFFDGMAKRPSVVVVDEGLGCDLVKGQDYTVSYSNNLKVGEATVTISGFGNYKGTITRQFTILDRLENLPKVNITPASKILSGRTTITIAYAGIDGYATEVRYTTDGTEPTSASTKYDKRFSIDVTTDTKVRAAAFLRGVRVSEIAEARYLPSANAVIVKSGVGCGPVTIQVGGVAPWMMDVVELGYDGTPTMRSGKIGNDGSSEMTASFTGDGVFEFSWKTSCEHDEEQEFFYDHVECLLDGEVVAQADGETPWTKVVVPVATKGDHTIVWKYVKDDGDDAEYPGEDCVWVDGVKFTFAAYIDFAADEEIVGELPERIVSASGYSITLPEIGEVKYAKHVFSGWTYGGKVYQPGDLLVVDAQEMVVKPVWTEVLEVAYDLNGGSGNIPVTQRVISGGSVELFGIGESSLAKHAFGGWLLDGEIYSAESEYRPVGDVTFTAVWVAKTLNAPTIAVASEHDEPTTTVEISSGDYDAVIYYTIDGSEPNVTNGTRYEGSFEVAGSVTIKAIATKDDYFDSEVVEATVVSTYTPTTVAFDGGEGVVGTMPSAIDTALRREIVLPEIGEAHLPKHKFGGWTDGVNVYQPGDKYSIVDEICFSAVWTPKVLKAPVITVAEVYDGEKTSVVITTDDVDAEIRYTLDGSEPNLEGGLRYESTFDVVGTTTIKAIVLRDDWFDSEIVEKTTVRSWGTLNACLDNEQLVFTTGGDANWIGTSEEAYLGNTSVCSGFITHNQSSWLETKVEGAGVLTFAIKVESEYSENRGHVIIYDGLTNLVDSVAKELIGGNIEWTIKTLEIEGEGEHTIRWVYAKDDRDEEWCGRDRAWIDAIVWTQKSTRPDAVEGASEETKAAFDQWILAYKVENPSAANVNAFILGLEPTATEEAIQEKVEEELANLDLGKLVEGDISAAVAEIQAKYPNAKVDLAPVEDLNSSAHLYKLVIKLK